MYGSSASRLDRAAGVRDESARSAGSRASAGLHFAMEYLTSRRRCEGERIADDHSSPERQATSSSRGRRHRRDARHRHRRARRASTTRAAVDVPDDRAGKPLAEWRNFRRPRRKKKEASGSTRCHHGSRQPSGRVTNAAPRKWSGGHGRRFALRPFPSPDVDQADLVLLAMGFLGPTGRQVVISV